MKSITVFFAALSLVCSARAGSFDDPEKTIGEFTVVPTFLPHSFSNEPQDLPLKNADPGTLVIINIATTLWKVITGANPAAEANVAFATAIPDQAKSWTDLAGWKGPVSAGYRLAAKNLPGVTVAQADYIISFRHGGKFQGKGKYLTDVRVFPRNVKVFAGFQLNVEAKVSPPFNLGTVEEPVAGLEILLHHKAGSIIKTKTFYRSFQISGDGRIAETTSQIRERSFLFQPGESD